MFRVAFYHSECLCDEEEQRKRHNDYTIYDFVRVSHHQPDVYLFSALFHCQLGNWSTKIFSNFLGCCFDLKGHSCEFSQSEKGFSNTSDRAWTHTKSVWFPSLCWQCVGVCSVDSSCLVLVPVCVPHASFGLIFKMFSFFLGSCFSPLPVFLVFATCLFFDQFSVKRAFCSSTSHLVICFATN